MPVAPSFKDFYILSDKPFFDNGKYYVMVKKENSKKERKIRWYNDIEFAKTYGNKMVNIDEAIPNMRHMYGFDNGPVLVIRNQKIRDENWLRNVAKANYTPGIGWYITSRDILPTDAPPHLKYLLLTFDEFRGVDNFHMRKPSEIANILKAKAMNKEWIIFND